ncbi:MAG: hypothetical protein WAT22_05520 [Saprospiraceae bacterium]|nr:hypothetical protein [Saprospiraceae bacterium]MBP6540883.1 hypothetical protein [Saprospiraceae bacterium]MBP9056561.1 hypothetical protein [Saprospiraceae bacterium]
MEFKQLLNNTVSNLFLIVWPPWGEEKESDIDISFGFVFKDERSKLYVIGVNKDELWAPHIFHQSLPENIYGWEDFHNRMNLWMNSGEDTDLIMNTEYYNVSQWDLFDKIVESEIIRIELIWIEGYDEPFGVKIHFKNDYIISTPISDGNTVETSRFNQNANIELFEKLGKIEYKTIE